MARAITGFTIAPMDVRGRDGVACDLKTFAALGLHGVAAVTAIDGAAFDATAIAGQMRGVLGQVRIDAVKLTCPGDAASLEVIADMLAEHRVQNLVVDPAGAVLEAGARGVLMERLLPLAYVLVPNIAEAEAMTGTALTAWEDIKQAGPALTAMGAANVVIKGGKREGDLATDLLFDGREYRDYTAERMALKGMRGTGSAFAAALAATLAKGETVQHSVAAAKAYVTKALQGAYDLGGEPALHHFYRYWQPSGS